MRILAKALLRFFLTGVATLLPFVVTVFIITWIVRMADAYIGPSSYFGLLINKIAGPGHAVLGYLFGYFVVVLLLIVLGILVSKATISRIQQGIDAMLARIPLIGKIYSSVTQLMELFGSKDQSGFERFGGVGYIRIGEIKLLGFLASSAEIDLDDGKYFLVFIPNSPIPATGFNMLVKVENFSKTDLPIEELAKLLMSLGILGSQILRPKIITDIHQVNTTDLFKDEK
jgi:uncharacterized membrane protein